MTDCITDCIGVQCPSYYICNPDEEPVKQACHMDEKGRKKEKKLPKKLRNGWS